MSIERIKESITQTAVDYIQQPNVQEFIAKTGIELLRLKKYINMHVEGEENLASAAELLGENAVLATFNHNSIFDLLGIFILTQDHFPEGTNYMFPASSKFFPETGDTFENPLITKMIHEGAKKYQLELFPVFQHGGHDPERAGKQVPNKPANTGNVLKMKRHIMRPHNVLVMAPEGGRSRTGSMIKPGMDIDFFISNKTQVLPFSIWGTENMHKVGDKKFHPMAPIHIVVGEPMSHDQIHSEAEMWNVGVTDIASLHTAINLPDKYKGVYGPGNFPDFYRYYYENGRTY